MENLENKTKTKTHQNMSLLALTTENFRGRCNFCYDWIQGLQRQGVCLSLFPTLSSGFYGGSHIVNVGSFYMGGDWPPEVSIVLGTLLTEKGRKRQKERGEK